MIEITRCEACGRVIPATEHGCPYCERERQGEVERPYLPLAVRLLLVLFGLALVVSGTLAVLTLAHAGGSGAPRAVVIVLALARLLLAAVTLVALRASRPWGRWLPLVFIGVEVLLGIAARVGWIPASAWRGGLLAPLWISLFLFLFLRPDVQGRFDPRVLDRHDVIDLIRDVQKEKRG